MRFLSANTYNIALLGALFAFLPLDLAVSGIAMGIIVFLDHMFSPERMFRVEDERGSGPDQPF